MHKQDEHNTQPAKAPEHGAVRKHDALTVSNEEEQSAPHADTYFNDDGNKTEDLEYIGSRHPDTDPDDREPDAQRDRKA